MNETVACRICLANSNVKLYDVNVLYNLKAAYETMTGTQISIKDGLPQQICSYCGTLLLKYISFKEKCCYTQDLYKYLLRSQKEVTKDDVVLLQKQFTNLSQSNTLPIIYMQYVEPTIKEEFEVNQESFIKFEEEVVKKRKKKVVKKKKLKSETNYQDVDTKFEDIAGVDMDSDGDQENYVDTVMLRGCGLLLVKKATEGTTEESKPIKQHRVKTSKDENIDLKEAEMVILSKEEQLEEMEARKASSNYTQSVYKCDLCYRGFITEATYNNHMVRHDPKSGDFVCDICNFRWTEARFLRSHVVTSHERKYLCKLCDHVSRSSYRAREHIKWHNGFKFECKICGATFAKSTSKLTHMRLHHPSKHSCEICGESFIGEYGLKMHKRRAHRDLVEDTTHQCLQCEARFQSMEALTRHTEESRNGLCDPNLSPCLQCGEGCESDELLKSHVKEHQNSFTCEECERSFNNSRSYSIHYQRVHLGVKLKQYKPSLRRAADTVVCEICGKKCITRATLRYHQRTHTGEKPYQCTECPKKFSVFQRLQIHRRTHTGECPYKCNHCPKAFKHKAALNRHDRVHTGAKPYTCSHCGKSFSQSNSRKLHVNTVHLKMPAPYRNRKTT